MDSYQVPLGQQIGDHWIRLNLRMPGVSLLEFVAGVGETLSLDHFSDRDETRLSSRSRLRHFLSLSLSLESRNCSKLSLSLSLEVETSLMCYPICTFLFPMHTSSCLDLAPSKVLNIKNQYKTLCLGQKCAKDRTIT